MFFFTLNVILSSKNIFMQYFIFFGIASNNNIHTLGTHINICTKKRKLIQIYLCQAHLHQKHVI